MSRAVIFDLDGTLIDSVDFHAEAWQRALAHFGHRVSFRRVRSQIGKGGDQLMPVFLSKQEIRSFGPELQAYLGELFKKKFQRRVRPFANVSSLFRRLKKAGWNIAIASSAKTAQVNFYLQRCRVARLVDAIATADDANRSKPHADIFNAARNRLHGIRPRHCVVVGDSPFDAIAARRGKIRAVGFLSGGFGRTKLRAAGCCAIYRDPADLLARFETSLFAADFTK